MMRILDAKHLFVTYASLVLIFIGVFTTKWSVSFRIIVLGKLRANSGLFQSCEEGVCGDLTGQNADEYMATFLILAGCVASLLCGLTFTAQFILWDETNRSILMMSTVAFTLAVLGAVLIFIGCMLYSYELLNEHNKPGYSFYLTFCGAMVLSLGGSLAPKY